MRIGVGLLVAVLAVSASGCNKLSGGDSPTAPSGAPATGSTIIYTALGASDVIGFGSSKPCLPFEDCNGNGYVWVAARQWRSQGYTVNVSSLGIPTTVISRSFAELGAQYGNERVSNILDGELPFVDRNSTVVSVFTGGNEVNDITAALGAGAGSSNRGAFIDAQVATFATAFATLVSGIRSRAPGARIVVLNLPNLAGVPYLSGASLAQKQAAQRASVGITNAINATGGIRVVDLMCDARLYQRSNFSGDGFHPNDSGYAVLGAELARAVTDGSYPSPRSSCAQMTLF